MPSVDRGCMYRGAAGGPTVERSRHPGADAWNQSVSRTVDRKLFPDDLVLCDQGEKSFQFFHNPDAMTTVH